MKTEDTEEASWGYQLVIDCFGCSEEICCDLGKGYDFLEELCSFLEMTKQTQPYIFKTCTKAFPGRSGYSGWIPIIESGIQIHTSARNRFVSIDVYSCKTFSRNRVEPFVADWFRPDAIDHQFFYRGRDFRRRASISGSRPQDSHGTESPDSDMVMTVASNTSCPSKGDGQGS